MCRENVMDSFGYMYAFVYKGDFSQLALEAVVLGASDLVERVSEVAHDLELVEDHVGVLGVLGWRVPEGLPHVHRGESQ